MVWLAVAALFAAFHLAAIVLGRHTADVLQRTAFISGLLGFLSFALVLYVGVTNICIAGACGHSTPVGPYVALGLFLV
ncbi:hypothetical protein, partial [Lysobacter xanthus]